MRAPPFPLASSVARIPGRAKGARSTDTQQGGKRTHTAWSGMHNGFFRGVDRLERSASEVGREGRPIGARPRPHGHALTESVILKKPLRSFFLHGGRGQRERGEERQRRGS